MLAKKSEHEWIRHFLHNCPANRDLSLSLSLSCMAFSVNEVVRVACDSRSLDWQRTRTTLWTLYAIDSNDKPKKGFEPSQLNFAFSFYLPKTETCAWITKKRIHHRKKRTTNFANHHVMDALSFRIITSSVRSVKKKSFKIRFRREIRSCLWDNRNRKWLLLLLNFDPFHNILFRNTILVTKTNKDLKLRFLKYCWTLWFPIELIKKDFDNLAKYLRQGKAPYRKFKKVAHGTLRIPTLI